MSELHREDGAVGASIPRKGKNDLVLIVGLLLLVCAAALVMFIMRTSGDTVTVLVDGQIFGEYPLSEDRTVRIQNGESYNLLVIENGRAYVLEASCPDGICVAHRPIGYNGESIICLPNQVVVEIRTAEGNQPDIIM